MHWSGVWYHGLTILGSMVEEFHSVQLYEEDIRVDDIQIILQNGILGHGDGRSYIMIH